MKTIIVGAAAPLLALVGCAFPQGTVTGSEGEAPDAVETPDSAPTETPAQQDPPTQPADAEAEAGDSTAAEEPEAPGKPESSGPGTPSAPVPEPDPATGEPAPEAPGLDAFTGLSASSETFRVTVNEAYVDDDGVLTDGAGYMSEAVGEDGEYQVFNVQITNESDAPAYFDWGGSAAFDAQNRLYMDDWDAAFAACDDYCGEDLNPGRSAETDVVFAVPAGTELVRLELTGDPSGSEAPAQLAP